MSTGIPVADPAAANAVIQSLVPFAQEAAREGVNAAMAPLQQDLAGVQVVAQQAVNDLAAHQEQIEARFAALAEREAVAFLRDPRTWYLLAGILVFLVALVAGAAGDWVLTGNARALTALECAGGFLAAHAATVLVAIKKSNP